MHNFPCFLSLFFLFICHFVAGALVFKQNHMRFFVGARLFLRTYSHVLVGRKPPKGSMFSAELVRETREALLNTTPDEAVAPPGLVPWLNLVISDAFKSEQSNFHCKLAVLNLRPLISHYIVQLWMRNALPRIFSTC